MPYQPNLPMKLKDDIQSSVLTVLLGSIVVMLAGAFVACSEKKPPGYYVHDDGFSVVIPDGWNSEENIGGASIVMWQGERDSTAPTVTIVMRDIPPEADNNMFADLNFREASERDGYVAMRSEEITIDGDSLPLLVYAYKQGGGWRQGMLTSIVAGNDDEKYGFVILCSSMSGKLEGDKDEYKTILSSFGRQD